MFQASLNHHQGTVLTFRTSRSNCRDDSVYYVYGTH